jgi:CheY-like chemotaxis protein
MTIHVELLNVAELINASAQTVRKSAADKGVLFQRVIEPGVPDQILGDGQRIRQILINLLANAVKFTPNGSVTLRVAAVAEGDSQFLAFSVEDTGIGLSPGAIGSLFQPFAQADMKMNRRFGGTGLGLAISKRLAEAMRGSLTVRSTAGEGSTFTFRLPLEISDEAMAAVPSPFPDRAGNKSALTEQPPPVPTGGMPADGSLVLVVEDDPDNSWLAGKMLNALGCRAEFAFNGQEAIEAFRPGKFHAILMDIQMPVMNGLAATEKIRKLESEAGGYVPIIALTANVMPGDRDRCLAAGMDDVLTKPFNKVGLAAVLANSAMQK